MKKDIKEMICEECEYFIPFNKSCKVKSKIIKTGKWFMCNHDVEIIFKIRNNPKRIKKIYDNYSEKENDR